MFISDGVILCCPCWPRTHPCKSGSLKFVTTCICLLSAGIIVLCSLEGWASVLNSSFRVLSQVNLASCNSVFVLEVPATQSIPVPSSVTLDSRVYRQQLLGSYGHCQQSFSYPCVQSRASGVWMTYKRVLPCDPVFLTKDRRMRAEVWQSSVAALPACNSSTWDV